QRSRREGEHGDARQKAARRSGVRGLLPTPPRYLLLHNPLDPLEISQFVTKPIGVNDFPPGRMIS
ncbi:hypothetical protein ACWC5I_42825, partial [Kitasatospora sp. NPDC001574]